MISNSSRMIFGAMGACRMGLWGDWNGSKREMKKGFKWLFHQVKSREIPGHFVDRLV